MFQIVKTKSMLNRFVKEFLQMIIFAHQTDDKKFSFLFCGFMSICAIGFVTISLKARHEELVS